MKGKPSNYENATKLVSFGAHRSKCGSRYPQCGQSALESESNRKRQWDGLLAEETAKPAPEARMNVDSNGVILKGYDPVAYFTRHPARQRQPGNSGRIRGCDLLFRFRGRQSRV